MHLFSDLRPSPSSLSNLPTSTPPLPSSTTSPLNPNVPSSSVNPTGAPPIRATTHAAFGAGTVPTVPGVQKMSARSKATLAVMAAVTVGTVLGVHYLQESERKAMHQGVIRDEERMRVKREREAEFAMQKELEEEYLKIQKVSGKSPDA